MPRPQPSTQQRLQINRLLNSLYTPAEIATFIGANKRTISKHWVRWGCPHVRDATGRLYINGVELRQWIEAVSPRVTLQDGEAYCLSCRQPRQLQHGVTVDLPLTKAIQSTCPVCGSRLFRFI